MTAYDAYLAELEGQYSLPKRILYAVEQVESSHRMDAVSRKGAIGPFQFMPETAKRFQINPLDRMDAARGAARYLRSNYDMLGSWEFALAGYNAGEGNVAACHCIPDLTHTGETPNYVRKVMSLIGLAPAAPVQTVPATVTVQNSAPVHQVFLLQSDFYNAVKADRLSLQQSIVSHY